MRAYRNRASVGPQRNAAIAAAMIEWPTDPSASSNADRLPGKTLRSVLGVA